MRISDIRVVETDSHCEVHASVKCDTHWVWGDEPFPLWYRFPREYGVHLNVSNGDPFFAAMLAPAMLLGESLEIEAPVSHRLLNACDAIQSVYHAFEKRLTPIVVKAPVRSAELGPATHNAALFFSMGVDSSYSLLKNVRQHPEGDGAVSHLVVVEGFDVYLWESERFPPMLASITAVAEEIGKLVLPVTTNLREFTDRVVDWVRVYHGAALASVVLALGPAFATVRIAAAQTYARLVPRGAHPLLDPLWGTEATSFLHDGLEAERLEKIRSISTYPVLAQHIRVCATDEVTGEYNCGRCEKCVRTMIGLHIAGALKDSRTFPRFVDPELVRKLTVPHAVARYYLEELRAALGDSAEDAAIRAALEHCLSKAAAIGEH